MDCYCPPFFKLYSVFNKSLLGKWKWRFLVEPNSFWCQVIKAKYMGKGVERILVVVGCEFFML